MPISTKAHHGHILSAGFGIFLLSIVAISLFLGNGLPSFGRIGLYSLSFMIIYFVAMRLVYAYEKRQLAEFMKELAVELKYKDISIGTAVFRYVINAIVVIIAALFLPKIGQSIASATGLGQTFVGNILIAISTSLPEVVVSISAIRMDAVDLAIGNLFGSNIFNVLILAIDDIFFARGPILSFANPSHVISALSAICMTAIAVIGLTYRAERKRLFMAWDSIGIMLVYISNVTLLYMTK
jgi:cation:H+ antiporter